MTHASPHRIAGPSTKLSRFGEPVRFEPGLYRLAPDTYAWMVPNGSWGETNLGLVDCGGASVMIDTGWDLRCTREMLDVCRDVAARSPIELVVNTHADGDHCWGNQLFPGREILATNACIHQMHHLRPETLRAVSAGSRLFEKIPAFGLPTLGRYMRTMLAPYDFEGVRITPATKGFSRSTTFAVKGVDFVVTEVGPGHTDGDAIVHVPSRRVVYAGDILFVGVTPVIWAGPLENVVAGLRRVLSLDVDVIVPGHGPLASRADVQGVIDYWEHVHGALERCHRQGLPADEAAGHVLRSPDFRSRPWARWDASERLVTSAFTLYRHWGTPPPNLPGPLASLALMRRQALVAESLGLGGSQ